MGRFGESVEGHNKKSAPHADATSYGGKALGVSDGDICVLPTGTSGQFLKRGATDWEPGLSPVPSGAIVMWHGLIANIPTGWVLCNGANSTPDLRAKFVRGAPDATEPGTTGGEDAHALTVAELAAHAHTINVCTGDALHEQRVEVGENANSPHTEGTSSVGSGDAHENRPAYYEILYIMKS